jgi:hypothetical protein
MDGLLPSASSFNRREQECSSYVRNRGEGFHIHDISRYLHEFLIRALSKTSSGILAVISDCRDAHEVARDSGELHVLWGGV